MQRTLDPLDVEGLMQLWHQHEADCTCSTPHSEGFSDLEPCMEDWVVFVESYLSRSHPRATQLPENNISTLKYALHSFLLSASFKDCSVMLCLHPDLADSKLFVIDLDPKSVSKIDKWYKLDRDIALSLQDSSRKPCVDAN
jgi:inositol-pentakisphosphate 2-kinase